MTEETPEVRELTLTGLGAEGHEARLTLTDVALLIETQEGSPLPEWLRGEIPFVQLDIAYVDPAKLPQPEAGETEEEADQVRPGFRLSRWIEMPGRKAGEIFDRRGAFLCDDGHVDLGQAEAFALAFCRLAGRPLPGEKAEAEAAPEAVAEEAPSAEPEAAAPEVAPAEVAEEAPAFAGSDAFAAPDSEDAPAFAGSDAFAAPDDDEPEDKAFV